MSNKPDFCTLLKSNKCSLYRSSGIDDARGREPEAWTAPQREAKESRKGSSEATAFSSLSRSRRRSITVGYGLAASFMGAAPFPCPRASVPHARVRVAAPPPAWNTGAGHPADDRQPHARRAHFLHGPRQTSPLPPVGALPPRRRHSRRGGHGSHVPKYVLEGAKKPPSRGGGSTPHGRLDHAHGGRV